MLALPPWLLLGSFLGLLGLGLLGQGLGQGLGLGPRQQGWVLVSGRAWFTSPPCLALPP